MMREVFLDLWHLLILKQNNVMREVFLDLWHLLILKQHDEKSISASLASPHSSY